MKNVLIISPRFPPVNAADMHRVRHSLPYFERLDWRPEVWRVDPDRVERERDPLLADTVPDSIDVRTIGALDPNKTRLFGLGSLALRSLPHYYWQVSRRLKRGNIDLVYFSTTAFPVMVLGPYWKYRFGVPYVIDMQDPWHDTYYLDQPPERRPPKFWFSYLLNKYLEPVAMHEVGGIVSVSEGYCKALCERYENIDPDLCSVIPFGAADIDFDIMESSRVTQSVFNSDDDATNIVYAGVVPPAMTVSIQAIFTALALGLKENPRLFERVQMYFIGTSYAPTGRGKKVVQPIADSCGVGDHVLEQTSRVSYFQALRLLRDSDHLIMPGSEDPNYTASKLYPYILSHRPVLAVFHENSSVVGILRTTNAGSAVTFGESTRSETLAEKVYREWTSILERLPYMPDTDWDAFEPYTAKAMARRQVEVFNRVV